MDDAIKIIINKLPEGDRALIKQYIIKLELENQQMKSDLDKEWDLK